MPAPQTDPRLAENLARLAEANKARQEDSDQSEEDVLSNIESKMQDTGLGGGKR